MKLNDESACQVNVDTTMVNLIKAQHPILNTYIYCCWWNRVKLHTMYNWSQYFHVFMFASHYLAVLKNERRWKDWERVKLFAFVQHTKASKDTQFCWWISLKFKGRQFHWVHISTGYRMVEAFTCFDKPLCYHRTILPCYDKCQKQRHRSPRSC